MIDITAISDKPLRFMVPGAAGAAGISVIKALRRLFNQPYIVAVDTDRFAVGFSMADAAVHIRSSEKERRFDELADAVSRHSIEIVFPTSRRDPLILAERIQEIEKLGAILLANPSEVLTNCDDKLTYYTIAPSLYGPPDRIALTQGFPDRLPCFVKPRRGSGSEGAKRIATAADWTYESLDETEYIVQDVITGKEYSVDTWLGRDGQTFAVPRLRLRTYNGLSVLGRVSLNPNLMRAAQEVSLAFRISGVSCIQFIVSKSSKIFLIDVNPRFGGSFSMSEKAGVDFVAMALADHFELSYSVPEIREIIVGRCYEEYVLHVGN